MNCNHVISRVEVDGHFFCVKCDWSPTLPNSERRHAVYSGPGKSGICTCGHSWEDHHGNIVVRPGRVLTFEGVREYCLPGECEFYGWNEDAGLDENREPHCFGYQDSGT